MKKNIICLLVFFLLPAPLLLAGRGEPGEPGEPDKKSLTPSDVRKKPRSASPLGRREKARRIGVMNRRVLTLFKAGKFKQCLRMLEAMLKIDPDNSTTYYNLACVYAQMGKSDLAIENLYAAIDRGYADFRHLMRDEDLQTLRELDAYKSLIARKDKILQQRAQKVLDRLRGKFGEGFLYEIDHDNKIIFATDIDRKMLDDLKAYLPKYARSQWKLLFSNGFEQYVAVVIPKNAINKRSRVGGFYRHMERMLTAKTIGMTLTHEFTHALHFADQDALGQRHPIWIIEGLATLFETSEVIDGLPVPLPNRRTNVIKHFVRTNGHMKFKDLLKLNHSGFMRKATITYAQVRYVMMFLYEKGLLRKWYDAYVEGYEQDRSGAKAMEKVFAMSLDKIEADWIKWIKRRKGVPYRLLPRNAYIGIRPIGRAEGLEIVRVFPGSGAFKAGLKRGDLLVKMDGKRFVEGDSLLRAVKAHEVGDKVKLLVRRNGEYRTIIVTLGAMPHRLPDMPPQPSPPSRPAKKKAA